MVAESPQLSRIIEAKRLKVAKLLSSILLFLGVLVLLSRFITASENGYTNRDIVSLLLNVLFVIGLGLTRFYLVQRSYRLVVAGIVFINSIALVALFLISSTLSWMGYILIGINLLVIAIIVNTKASSLLALIYGSAILAIMTAHQTGWVEYTPFQTTSATEPTIVSLFMLALFAHIIKIGYSQIEESYSKAEAYARELEQINQNLDKKVMERTKQLKKSFRKQYASLYESAVKGRITRSLIHDISTPLSSLEGSMRLVENTEGQIDQEVLNVAQKSITQMNRIVKSSKSMLKNDFPEEEFYPKNVIEEILAIHQAKLQKENIDVEVDIPDELSMHGVVGIFERIILNLVKNSEEELEKCNQQKKMISISGEYSDDEKLVYIMVRDNGGGIPLSEEHRIFEPSYSSKDENNLGLGLNFVKVSTVNFFAGDVKVDSKLGEYTEFTLILKQNGIGNENKKSD